MDKIMTMKDRLKKLRKSKNLTQTELATSTGISLKTINTVENGKCDLSTEQLAILSDFFNVSIDYLVKGVESERTISETEQEILEVLRGDRDMTNAVMEFAKVKKKAISFTRSYAAANQNAVMG